MALQLNNIVPWGRTFDEYAAMFALDAGDRSRSILGYGDGPASFNAEAQQRNVKVVSADPLYEFSVPQIRKRIAETAPQIASEIRNSTQDFVWNHFKSVNELIAARMKAMQVFLADLNQGRDEGRYVPAELPNLPFFDGTFDLALCSHSLFSDSAHCDAPMHILALRELRRVAQEVRVFPLLELTGAQSRHLPEVMKALAADGCTVRLEPVDYELQKGGNQMLRLVG
jgi:hypothetical protein